MAEPEPHNAEQRGSDPTAAAGGGRVWDGPVRILLMGTGPFAGPTFEALLNAPGKYSVLGLVTRPERGAAGRKTPASGRGSPAAEAAPKEIAERRNLPIVAPEDVNSEDAQIRLREFAAELFVVCDYGQILSRETLAIAPWGGINLHGSLLPAYRGAAPIQWAIYRGETETGVSVIRMTSSLDAGPCLAQSRTPIGPKETAAELEPRLARMGAEAVEQAIELLLAGKEADGTPQDARLASRAPRLKKQDGLVDWRRTARQIFDQVRAFQPWPTTYTFLHPGEGGEPERLILEQVAVADEEGVRVALGPGEARPAPGMVISADGGNLTIICGSGAILPLQVQPAGRRPMATAEYLRGRPVKVGDRFA